jgi:hypothetical protein
MIENDIYGAFKDKKQSILIKFIMLLKTKAIDINGNYNAFKDKK